MHTKRLLALIVVGWSVTVQISDGKSISKPAMISEKAGSSAIINENQQTLATSSANASSISEGNGQPHSAVAFAWQGGQTSAHGSQNATATSNASNAQSAGTSNCQQGYYASAGGPNSTLANSSGNADCNATYSDQGSHNATLERLGMVRPQLPHVPNINMNSLTGQFGEGQSGQFHSSSSNAGGPGGFLNLLTGGFANSPQGGLTIQQSTIDSSGKPAVAVQDILEDQGVDSNQQTVISIGGNLMDHATEGNSSVFGLGASVNDNFNSHTPTVEDEEEEGHKLK